MMETSNTLNSGMCRCCSSEGTFKDIKTKYHWMGDEEVYADMLTDCFDIKISTPENMDNGICEVCITQLRNAANFKKQVLHTEEQFKKRLQGQDIKNPIKLESVEDPDPIESDHLSDPDFSGPEYDVPIKVELEEKPKAKKRQAKPAASRAKKPKSEAETSSQHDSEDESVLVKVEINIESEEQKGERKEYVKDVIKERTEDKHKAVKVIPKISSKSIIFKKTTEMDLHAENLQTIMRCSNATPLRLHGRWYTCCFCPDRFNDTAALKMHTIEKHPDGKNALLGRNMSMLMIRVDITGLQCSLCNVEIDELEKLIKHLKDEHSRKFHNRVKNYMIPFKFDVGRDFKCTICDQEFNNFKMLVQHMHVHYPNFVCGSCGSTFINQKSLHCHASRHANGEYKCESCELIFDNHVKLKDHQKFAHRGFKERNKCDHCEKRFVDYTAKIDHMIKEHGMPANQAKCSACDKTFKNYKCLTLHKRSFHMLEKKHKCPECDKMFFSTSQVKKHMLTHTGQRDFKCVVCSKSYGTKSTLIEHMRIHADDRRFKCEHCGMAFVQKCSWRGHMRSKHGEEV